MKTLVASAVLALTIQVCLCSFAQGQTTETTQTTASAPQLVAASSEVAVTGTDTVGNARAGLPTLTHASPSISEALPKAHTEESRPEASHAEITEAAMLTPPPAPLGVAAAPEVRTHTKLFDTKFTSLGLAVFATTTMDMEFTQHCLKANTCVELNPTLPTAHWAMYATNTPVNLGVMWLAHKRRAGGHRDWWIWPALDAGIHVYGITTNARYEFGKR